MMAQSRIELDEIAANSINRTKQILFKSMANWTTFQFKCGNLMKVQFHLFSRSTEFIQCSDQFACVCTYVMYRISVVGQV